MGKRMKSSCFVAVGFVLSLELSFSVESCSERKYGVKGIEGLVKKGQRACRGSIVFSNLQTHAFVLSPCYKNSLEYVTVLVVDVLRTKSGDMQ